MYNQLVMGRYGVRTVRHGEGIIPTRIVATVPEPEPDNVTVTPSKIEPLTVPEIL